MERMWDLFKYPIVKVISGILPWYENKIWNPVSRHPYITMSVVIGIITFLYILDKI